VDEMYVTYMASMKDVLILSGFLALTINLIVMLINMIINAATGRGFKL